MKVSIITATYNSAATLQKTFDSVAEQDYSDIEYIVVDGGSKDGTLDLIKSNHNIISSWISESDKGIYDAINKGIELATGDVIGLIHSDDFFASNLVVSQVVNSFNDDVDAVYGDLNYVDRENTSKVIREWKSQSYIPKLFYIGWMPAHPTFYLRKQRYDQFGLYNTNFKISADYELMLRMLLKHGLKSVHLNIVLVHMRVGGESNVSFSNRWLANKEDAEAWRINDLKPRVYTRWAKPLSKILQFM